MTDPAGLIHFSLFLGHSGSEDISWDHIAKYWLIDLWLLASKQPQNLYDIYLMLYVQF